MKRLFFNLFLCTAVILNGSFAVAGEKIILAADDWCPYNCTPNSARPGYAVEIAKAIYEPLGYHIDYVQASWPEALDKVNKGVYTAAIGSEPDELPSGVFPKETIGYVNNIVLQRKEDVTIVNSVEAIKDKRVGIMKGYDFTGDPIGDYVVSHVGNGLIREYESEDGALTLVKILKNNELDVVIDERTVLKYLSFQVSRISDFKEGTQLSSNLPIYLGFSPNNPKSKKYAKIFDEGIKRLRKSGELELILLRYGLDDWK